MLWFIPDNSHLDILASYFDFDKGVEACVIKWLLAALIGFVVTCILGQKLEEGCAAKQQINREDASKSMELWRENHLVIDEETYAEFSKRKEELEELRKEGKFDSYNEDELDNLKSVLEAWEKQNKGQF